MRRAEYQRSQACYEQYRTVNGMRPEAFGAAARTAGPVRRMRRPKHP